MSSVLNTIYYKDARASELVVSLYRGSELIPFFGSGFTKGCRSFKSTVPDAKTLVEGIKQIVLANIEESEERKNQIKNLDSLKSCFSLLSKIPAPITRSYLESVFSRVRLPQDKENVVKLEWPGIFTFNIDDAIERCATNYTTVLPFKEISTEYLAAHKCIFKIHGDISEYVKYEKTDVVFTWREYATSIERNSSTLTHLKHVAKNGSVLFVGCSLDAEVDLQYLSNDLTFAKSIFLKKGIPTVGDEIALESYGIKTVIYFDEYDQIYSWLYDGLCKVDISPRVQTLELVDEPSELGDIISYISQGGPIIRSNDGVRVANLPSITVERTLLGSNRSAIAASGITVVRGRRFCGKTTFLLEIFKELREYQTYFFSSTEIFSDQTIKILKEADFTSFIFDSNSLSIENFKEVLQTETASTNRVIFCFDNADFEHYRHFLSRFNREFHEIVLPNALDSAELMVFEDVLNKKGLPVYARRETLLDYSYRVYSEYKADLPASKLFDKDINEELFKVSILVAAFDKASPDQLLTIDKDFNVDAFVLRYGVLFEQEKIKGDIGSRVVCNSKPWLLNMIKEFSKKSPAKASLYTSDLVEQLVVDGHRETANALIRFDKLNDLFSEQQHGSAALIRLIYINLKEVYNNITHYWLQMAKCELMAGRSLEDIDSGVRYARKVRLDENLGKLGGEGSYTYYSATLILAQLLCKKYEINKDFGTLDEILKTFLESFENYSKNQLYLEKVKTNYRRNRHSLRFSLDELFYGISEFGLLNKESIQKLRFYILDK